jgi:hypothetical protein
MAPPNTRILNFNITDGYGLIAMGGYKNLLSAVVEVYRDKKIP